MGVVECGGFVFEFGFGFQLEVGFLKVEVGHAERWTLRSAELERE